MNVHNQPLVSVLMAYYDNLKHVEESIKSVYAQTYKNWEFIVVDDCSPSVEAQELIRSLQKKYGFKLISTGKNSGAAKSFQLAFEHSVGDYVSIISHDDLYTDNKLEHSIKIILKQDLDAVYCNGAIITDDNTKTPQPFETREVVEALSKGQHYVADLICASDGFGCLLTQGAVYKRKIFTELSWMREKFLLDDFPFTIKVWQDYKTGFDEAVLYLYRHHEHNVHKDFWRWLPARVQVVSELVPPDKKIETLAYILINMGEFCVQKKLYDDAFRFATAGLVMASTEKNMHYAKAVILRIRSENKKQIAKELANKIQDVLNRTTIGFKIYRAVMKLLIALLPNKQFRRDMRIKLNI
ncbi:MAG: glycosyltransferase [Geobacteraceae bacterium]|nr:glycosyltransferase [Geobacteraceae bacterium]